MAGAHALDRGACPARLPRHRDVAARRELCLYAEPERPGRRRQRQRVSRLSPDAGRRRLRGAGVRPGGGAQPEFRARGAERRRLVALFGRRPPRLRRPLPHLLRAQGAREDRGARRRQPLHRGDRARRRLLRPTPDRRAGVAATLRQGTASHRLSSRALRLCRVPEPRHPAARPIRRARSRPRHRASRSARSLAEAGRRVPGAAAARRLGQRADAPLGSIPDVSRAVRSAHAGHRATAGRRLVPTVCGICGQYNFASPAPVQKSDIEAMTRTLVHRGPDDDGYHVDGPLGFGFRRLSIIDLAGGHQPMSDAEESVWVVFNGEIYNFEDLRHELEGYGHGFRTKSDTEVIVHGYKQWGDDVLNRLDGMFGLAIWDARRRRLVLARDRFGIKLIYYQIDGGRVDFGSEIRAVRAAMPDRPEIDAASLNLFLRYRYTPSPYTIFRDIRKLPPGTKLTFENGSYELSRWYRYRPRPFATPKALDEAAEELQALYDAAVRRHLISDVPVGLLLSGGIDSALLLALMNGHGSAWPTYTIGYGASFADDELADAAATAQALGSRHTSVTIDRSLFEAALPKIVAALEEPIAASSIVPMYFVCERARGDVKVALIGQGPDELFGGYRRHLGVRYGSLWARLPRWLRAPLARAMAALPRNETLKRGVHALATPDRIERYQRVLSI